MVTKIRHGARAHLYIAEHMKDKNLTDEQVANRIGVARETVTRWRGQQHRLNPEKIAALASALDLEPEDLWRPPSRPSLDAMLVHEPDDTVKRAAEAIKPWIRTGT